MVCLASALAAGCGASMSPEQAAAMSKYQSLGAKIEFQGGGYALNLNGMRLEDKDLAQLQDIPRLKSLTLVGTPVTDQGLKQLEAIQTLEMIDLTNTAVTLKGIESLKQALPNAEIAY